MIHPRLRIFLLTLLLVAAGQLSSGCVKATPPPVLPTATVTATQTLRPPTPTASPTSTPLPPTPTSEPLAALVNGEGILLAEFQAELARFQEAVGTNLATEDNQEATRQVLDDMINLVLLSQSARQSGFMLDEAALQERIDQLVAQLGSRGALNNWMKNSGYSEESFRGALVRSIEAAWMRDQILATVPEKIEQIHARQILLYNAEDADQIYAQLNSGQDFASIATTYDPTTGGDLGWFPRGYLTEGDLELAIFNLQPGEYTGVIQTRLGFHIVQVIERDPARRLDPNARLNLQERALTDWLQTRREGSDIQILLP